VEFIQDALLSLRKHELIFSESSEVDFKKFLIVFLEEFFSVKITGHQEIKQSPQFFEPILYWSASQYKSVL
jgi:hypothetical protein